METSQGSPNPAQITSHASHDDQAQFLDEMLRPPIAHGMRALDRSFFKKSISLSAARIFDNKKISEFRTQLRKSKDLAGFERIQDVIQDPDEARAGQGKKCLLLRPGIQHDVPSTWPPTLNDLVDRKLVSMIPHSLYLDYNYWTYHEIMTSIFPESQHDDIPSGFSVVGHVAHFNLRDDFLPYKSLIGQLVLDKTPGVRTVINKTEDVGASNPFRTFSYELLAGDPSLDVETRESDCAFRFNFSDVYWNPRLSTEHGRILDTFKEGEAVCDVMAGVGPFAVPAGKRKVFCWGNDLNPASAAAMRAAIKKNKVWDFVRALNEDGHTFIKDAARRLLEEPIRTVEIRQGKPHRHPRPNSPSPPPPPPQKITRPKTFSHYIMNLPASALDFLPDFIGLYAGHESLFAPHTPTKLPMIHVYCFSTKSDDNIAESNEICERISELIGWEVKPALAGRGIGDGKEELGEGEVEVWDVRDVAPKKRMFCASFRLPPEVAFRVG